MHISQSGLIDTRTPTRIDPTKDIYILTMPAESTHSLEDNSDGSIIITQTIRKSQREHKPRTFPGCVTENPFHKNFIARSKATPSPKPKDKKKGISTSPCQIQDHDQCRPAKTDRPHFSTPNATMDQPTFQTPMNSPGKAMERFLLGLDSPITAPLQEEVSEKTPQSSTKVHNNQQEAATTKDLANTQVFHTLVSSSDLPPHQDTPESEKNTRLSALLLKAELSLQKAETYNKQLAYELNAVKHEMRTKDEELQILRETKTERAKMDRETARTLEKEKKRNDTQAKEIKTLKTKVEDLSKELKEKAEEIHKGLKNKETKDEELQILHETRTQKKKRDQETARAVEEEKKRNDTKAKEIKALKQTVEDLSKALKEKAEEIQEGLKNIWMGDGEQQIQRETKAQKAKMDREIERTLEEEKKRNDTRAKEIETLKKKVEDLNKALREKAEEIQEGPKDKKMVPNIPTSNRFEPLNPILERDTTSQNDENTMHLDTSKGRIYFRGWWNPLSPMYMCDIKGVNREIFKSAEHMFHHDKAVHHKNMKAAKEIWAAPTGAEAKKIATRYFRKGCLPSWKKIEREVMYKITLLKAEQNEAFRVALLNTGSATLLHNMENDSTWGIGMNGEGNNQQGKILMDARHELRQQMTSERTRGKTPDNNSNRSNQHRSTTTRNTLQPDNDEGNQVQSREQDSTKSKEKSLEKTYAAVVKTGTTPQWEKDCRPVAIIYGNSNARGLASEMNEWGVTTTSYISSGASSKHIQENIPSQSKRADPSHLIIHSGDIDIRSMNVDTAAADLLSLIDQATKTYPQAKVIVNTLPATTKDQKLSDKIKQMNRAITRKCAQSHNLTLNDCEDMKMSDDIHFSPASKASLTKKIVKNIYCV